MSVSYIEAERMMEDFSYLRVQRTTFKISDFLAWAQSDRLELNPYYQRRSVWRHPAKSLLIDTIMRGLPVPIIIIRDRLDLKSKSVTREVVDGQQRIRTVLTYLGFIPVRYAENGAPDDWKSFRVLKAHNNDLAKAGTFDSLSENLRRRFLDYEFPAHVLPNDTDDGTVLKIFTRLNSTGVKLTPAEERNAEFHGPFATLVKELALTNVHRWRDWRILSDNDISRMVEIDLAADLCITAAKGEIYANSKTNINNFYKSLEDKIEWEFANPLHVRFNNVIDQLDRVFDDDLKNGILTNRTIFWALWTAVYDRIYGLKTPLNVDRRPASLPSNTTRKLHELQRILSNRETLTPDVSQAISRSSTDLEKRRIRFDFLKSSLSW